MKFPKEVRRHCPKCKKHTAHTAAEAKRKGAGSARPLARYGKKRTGYGKGTGNLGRYGSKPAINKFKLTGKKLSKNVDIRFTCKECKKSHVFNNTFRAKKFEMV